MTLLFSVQHAVDYKNIQYSSWAGCRVLYCFQSKEIGLDALRIEKYNFTKNAIAFVQI